jgi:hypothetical protein
VAPVVSAGEVAVIHVVIIPRVDKVQGKFGFEKADLLSVFDEVVLVDFVVGDVKCFDAD